MNQPNRGTGRAMATQRGTPGAPLRTGKPHFGKSPSTVYAGHGKDKYVSPLRCASFLFGQKLPGSHFLKKEAVEQLQNCHVSHP